MCGIAGRYSFSRTEQVFDRNNFVRALAFIHHRGPDHSAIHLDNGIALGHNRLSIIDITEASHQPMCDASGRYWLIYNGEIFNFEQLRQPGITYHSQGDAEVLLHHLIRHGVNGLQALNGFFALAFYDRQEHKLLLAKDRFGEKPLYYHLHRSGIDFSSGLKPLVSMGLSKELNTDALYAYMRLTYIPAPHTALKNARKLQAGECIEIENGKARVYSWYKPAKLHVSDREENEARFKHLLEDAVKMRLISDRPIGAFLSGGIDSSIISMLASKHVKQLNTYSVSFPHSQFLDESGFALEVAQHIGSRHHKVEMTESEMLHFVRPMVSALEEPFADSSSLAVFALSKAVSSDIKVALSGDGADELLGGYHKHKALYLAEHPTAALKLASMAGGLVGKGSGHRESFFFNVLRKLHKLNEGMHLSPQERFIAWACFAGASEVAAYFLEDRSFAFDDMMDDFRGGILGSEFNSILKTDQRLVLQNDMLVKTDSMSMAHALEIRPPFLDYRIVEWSNTLSSAYKQDGKKGKLILRSLYESELPRQVFDRPKKGFEVPLHSWVRGAMKEQISDSLTNMQMPGISSKAVANLAKNFYNGSEGNTVLLYSLFVMDLWWKDIQSIAQDRP